MQSWPNGSRWKALNLLYFSIVTIIDILFFQTSICWHLALLLLIVEISTINYSAPLGRIQNLTSDSGSVTPRKPPTNFQYYPRGLKFQVPITLPSWDASKFWQRIRTLWSQESPRTIFQYCPRGFETSSANYSAPLGRIQSLTPDSESVTPRKPPYQISILSEEVRNFKCQLLRPLGEQPNSDNGFGISDPEKAPIPNFNIVRGGRNFKCRLLRPLGSHPKFDTGFWIYTLENAATPTFKWLQGVLRKYGCVGGVGKTSGNCLCQQIMTGNDKRSDVISLVYVLVLLKFWLVVWLQSYKRPNFANIWGKSWNVFVELWTSVTLRGRQAAKWKW